MSPTRRQVVSAVASGAVLPTTVTAASARQEDDDQEFSPEITINSNNMVATIGERDGDVDPDKVIIYTADGTDHEFNGAAEKEWQRGEAFDVGYTYDESRARIEQWHGVIERVEATKDDETVSATREGDSSLEVSCSLWQTPDEPPSEFTALSEGARKQHWRRGEQDLSEDQRQYGSPGRPLWTVAERNPEIAMRVDFFECEPETEKALWFDCTTVTVTSDELNQGDERIEGVQLTFNDGTTEHPPGTADEADNGAYEVPVTLSGSGENDGKVIKKLHFKVDRGEYTYWNLDAEQCSAEREEGGQGDSPDSDGSSDDGGDDGSGDDGGSDDGSGDDGGSDDGGSDDGSGSGESTETPSEGEPSGDDAEEPTSTPDSSDGSGGTADGDGGSSGSDSGSSSGDGGDGGGGSGGGGGASGGGGSSGSDGSEGSSDGVYQDDAEDTPTPRSVEVGNGTGDQARTETATGGGAGSTATASPNGSAGAGNGTAGTADGPVTTEGVAGEDQPGMGFISALGGLLGLGELARRRLDADEAEAPVERDE